MEPNDVRDEWADRSGEYSPAYYAYCGSNETSELVRDTLGRCLDDDAAVLELGCSSGRHLAHLADHGFGNLSDVDINAEAFGVMAEHYPALATDGTFYCDSIEDIVDDFDDGRFDAVCSVETLQHLHPDVEWIFEGIARITDSVPVTVENEGAAGDSQSPGSLVNYVDDTVPLYSRNWSRILTSLGFAEVDARRGSRDTARTVHAAG